MDNHFHEFSAKIYPFKGNKKLFVDHYLSLCLSDGSIRYT